MPLSVIRNPLFAQRLYYESTTASQTITNNTATVADLPASATYDNGASLGGGAMHDGTNNRVNITRTGVWHFYAFTSWAVNGTGIRRLQIRWQGSTVLAGTGNNTFGGIFGTTMSCETLYYVTTTSDYFDVTVLQTSGGNLATTTAVRATWLGPTI